jgi:hypothetical protein
LFLKSEQTRTALRHASRLLCLALYRAEVFSYSDSAWAGSKLSIRKGERFRIVDAHGYGKRIIVRADEILTAFVELQRQYISSR